MRMRKKTRTAVITESLAICKISLLLGASVTSCDFICPVEVLITLSSENPVQSCMPLLSVGDFDMGPVKQAVKKHL